MVLGEEFVDTEENQYRTISIENQVWTIDNYKGTHYRNGDLIQKAIDDETYLKLGSTGKGAWCLNYNDKERSSEYGYLYNWFSVHDARGFAPKGWRIPSEEDWNTLEKHLEAKTQNGTSWNKLIKLMNMSYSGSRGINGAFGGADKSAYWWKFMPEMAIMSWGRRLQSTGKQLESIDGFQRFGFSVRLIKSCL